ncbi:MAG: ATP-binding cassette domain-containing protein, partial [Clostridia bacterium]|nr:ATP-binding cassette domain-containing protein [Clostridia bacterium]
MTAEIKGLCKKYPSFELKDVSFGLEKGRIAGFIGRNGAGKTTTIKAMLNLIHSDGGSAEFFGLPLKDNETEIKKRIGYSSGT